MIIVGVLNGVQSVTQITTLVLRLGPLDRDREH